MISATNEDVGGKVDIGAAGRVADSPLRVALVGSVEAWVERAPSRFGELLTLERDPRRASVVHAALDGIDAATRGNRDDRRRRVVAHLQTADAVGLRGRGLRQLSNVDRVVVDSDVGRGVLVRALPDRSGRVVVIHAPVDVARFAPEPLLAESRERDIRLHRRRHRLAGPVVLFAGDYTPAGGLARAIDAVLVLRDEVPDVRLVALPLGAVDRRYLDQCERRALALGHHGVVEWTVRSEDLPLWFATADVAYLPIGGPGAINAASLALASGTPIVGGSELAEFVTDGVEGVLCRVDSKEAAADALRAILENSDGRYARAARQRAESSLDVASAERSIASLWLEIGGVELGVDLTDATPADVTS
jgi:glycosyltransferase involved in cell wall biosynthesis